MKVDWKLYLLIGIGLISALFFFLLFEYQSCFHQQFFSPAVRIEAPKEKSTTTLMFVGDVMLDRGVEDMIKKHGKSYSFPFLEINDHLKKADLLFGNLESVVSDEGYQIRETYPFRAEPQAVQGLSDAGFDVVSCANNHALDYGREALTDSIVKLDRNGVQCVGAGLKEKAYAPVLETEQGLKVAYLAYTYLVPEEMVATKERVGVAWLNEENLKQGIKQAKQADLIVVSLHFGEEYQKQPTSEQKHFSRLAIDSGADLVVGHHPHVVQEVKRYKQGWIAYSLGNFVFDQDFSEETRKGLILRVKVGNRKIKRVNSREVRINEKFQPVLKRKNPAE